MRRLSIVVWLGILLSGWARIGAQNGTATAGVPSPTSSPSAPAPQLTRADVAEMQRKLLDWPELERYRAANAALPASAAGERRVVFFGSSTTDNWGRIPGTIFFPGKPYVNRGISGQTTPQMLLRFRQDVVHLHPAAVVFLGGTNDVAGNTGPITEAETEDNIRGMAEIAKANGIRMVLASQLPVLDFPWRPGLQPAARLLELSRFEKRFAAEQGLVYLDYYSALVGPDGGFRPGLASDGVHPTAAAYAIMAPLAEAAIAQALAR